MVKLWEKLDCQPATARCSEEPSSPHQPPIGGGCLASTSGSACICIRNWLPLTYCVKWNCHNFIVTQLSIASWRVRCTSLSQSFFSEVLKPLYILQSDGIFKGPCKHNKVNKAGDNRNRFWWGIRIGGIGKATSVNVVNKHKECWSIDEPTC